jgi:hypothetical protein
VPAEAQKGAGIQALIFWTPASAGVTAFFKLFTQLSVFTIDRAKWVIQWRFALFEPLRAPYISA